MFVNKDSPEGGSPDATRNGKKIDLEKHQEASIKRKQSEKRKVALGFSTLVKSSKEVERGLYRSPNVDMKPYLLSFGIPRKALTRFPLI